MVRRKNRAGKRDGKFSFGKTPVVALSAAATLVLMMSALLWAQSQAKDPGVRGGPAGAGTFQSALTANEKLSEPAFTTQFSQTALVTWNPAACTPMMPNAPTAGCGLGPRFSSNSCASCHSQPAPGGSSPPQNPLFKVYTLKGAQNTMPSFEKTNGPVLVPHFPFQLGNPSVPDGLVHQLFVITGRSDARSCALAQPDFVSAEQENDIIYRQPLPTFGDGYIEIIQNSDILNNMNSNLSLKASLGIGGAVNIADDGTVNRLGWKAQWRAILPAAGAEENVETGITNEMFPTETDQTLKSCLLNPVPEDPTNYNYTPSSNTPWYFLANAERDADFIRFLEQPTPGACPGGDQTSCARGFTQFQSVGCVLCHTVSFTTPAGSIPSMGHITANLYSDLLLHHMGSCLADNITEGAAEGDMFRTPPLWNVGQRYWFMHDGRTNDILQAIQDHMDGSTDTHCSGIGSYPASEADQVILNFNKLPSTGPNSQQDVLNFLRSL
ncbi:MAG TPA: di-heme oxidoredictase family protein [Terriglobia bacterium]|nr:di-heme oxidoredictase family protein [Terriglobia bacterium]